MEKYFAVVKEYDPTYDFEGWSGGTEEEVELSEQEFNALKDCFLKH